MTNTVTTTTHCRVNHRDTCNDHVNHNHYSDRYFNYTGATTPYIDGCKRQHFNNFFAAQLQQLQPIFANTGYIKGAAVVSIDSYVGVPVKTILAAIRAFTSNNSVYNLRSHRLF